MEKEINDNNLFKTIKYSLIENNNNNNINISDIPTPKQFNSINNINSINSINNNNEEITNFGDLPTPADRSDSVTSLLNSQSIGIDSIFNGWDLGEKYQIERIIGRGSYGEVVQAVDIK